MGQILFILAFGLFATSKLLAADLTGIYRLTGSEGALENADLTVFESLVTSAKVIGLGESVHASEGFSRAKLTLIQQLILNQRVRRIAWETPRIQAELANQYLQTCGGSAKDALGGLFPVWKSRSVEQLFEWICEYNQKHSDDPVTLYGIDHQGETVENMARLQGFLVKALGSVGSKIFSSASACLGYGLTHDQFISRATEATSGKRPIASSDWQDCLTGLASIKSTLVKLDPQPNLADAQISLSGILGSESYIYYFSQDAAKAFEARDEGMFNIFTGLESSAVKMDGSKTLLWAHNEHIAMKHTEILSTPYLGAIGLGQRLARQFGERYFPTALISYRMGVHWPGKDIQEIPPPSMDSAEGTLHFAGFDQVLIDLKSTQIFSRSINFGGSTLVPGEQFQAILYLDRSPPMNIP